MLGGLGYDWVEGALLSQHLLLFLKVFLFPLVFKLDFELVLVIEGIPPRLSLVVQDSALDYALTLLINNWMEAHVAVLGGP